MCAHRHDIVIDGKELEAVRKPLRSCKFSDGDYPLTLLDHVAHLAIEIHVTRSSTHIRVEHMALFCCRVHIGDHCREPPILVELSI
jgi:hypothetical protein